MRKSPLSDLMAEDDDEAPDSPASHGPFQSTEPMPGMRAFRALGGGGKTSVVGPSGSPDAFSMSALHGMEEDAGLTRALARKKAIDAKDVAFAKEWTTKHAQEVAANLQRRSEFGTENPLLAAQVHATGVLDQDFSHRAAEDPTGAAAAVHHARQLLGLDAPSSMELGQGVRPVKFDKGVGQAGETADTLFAGKLAKADESVAEGKRRAEEAALPSASEEAAAARESRNAAVLALTNRLLEHGRSTGNWNQALDALQQYQLSGKGDADGLTLGHYRQIGNAIRFAAKAAPGTVLNVGGRDVGHDTQMRAEGADAQHQAATDALTPKSELPDENAYAAGEAPPADQPADQPVSIFPRPSE